MSENQNQEKLVGYQEVAGEFGVSIRTVKRQVRDRKIPFMRFGRAVRFKLSDVRARIEADTKKPPAINLPPRPGRVYRRRK